MEAKHTKGPWRWVDHLDGSANHPRESDAKSLDHGGILAADGSLVCWFGNGAQYYPMDGEEPSEAHRALMVAAPELLAQLIALRDEYTRLVNAADACAHDWNGMYLVDDAIAKATGQSR